MNPSCLDSEQKKLVSGKDWAKLIVILSREFVLWVVIANAIAWQIAFLVLSYWLNNFAYKIDLNISIFIFSGFRTIAIAILTVGLQTLKAATMNPVKTLIYE